MSRKMSLKELDFNNIGSWPAHFRYAFCAFLAVMIVVLAWFLFIGGKKDELANLEAKETELRSEFETKQGKAANFALLKAQLEQMRKQLQEMLRQLPSKTDMPGLIIDISQTALAAGIRTDLFEPGAEVPKEFYAEKPITLRMVGTYHQFGTFMSGVASLPRVVILTMNNISLTPAEGAGDKRSMPAGTLSLQGMVKTYRYLDESDAAAPAGAAPAPATPPPAGGAK